MNKYGFGSFFIVETSFLPMVGIAQASCYADNGYQATDIHVRNRTDKPPTYKTCNQGANAPSDKFPFETPIYKGLLQPLVNREMT